MALFRRGKWWWTDFSVNGVRYRQPIRDKNGQHTKDWREALSREKELIAEAQTRRLSAPGESFARLAFSEAAKRYLDSRKLELSDRSFQKERPAQTRAVRNELSLRLVGSLLPWRHPAGCASLLQAKAPQNSAQEITGLGHSVALAKPNEPEARTSWQPLKHRSSRLSRNGFRGGVEKAPSFCCLEPSPPIERAVAVSYYSRPPSRRHIAQHDKAD